MRVKVASRMFGKRKQEHRHRDGGGAEGDGPDAVAPLDPELEAALAALGRNEAPPLPRAVEQQEAPAVPSDDGSTAAEPEATVPTGGAALREVASGDAPASIGQVALEAALNRERRSAAEHKAALAESRAEAQSLAAELKQARAALAATSVGEAQATAHRAADLEKSVTEATAHATSLTEELERLRAESEAQVDALTAEIAELRADAAAATVALERAGRESAEREAAVEEAERRADQLAAEVAKLRAESAAAPAQVQRLRREAERETALIAALERARDSGTRAESLAVDNLRLSEEMAAHLKSQATVLSDLTTLQAEIGEQRAWLAAQVERFQDAEAEQAATTDELRRRLADRDAEVEALHQQLLDVEVRRAEEAASFLAALDQGPSTSS